MIYFFKFVEEDEKVYWEKINADRMTRYNAKRGKKRGTEKVNPHLIVSFFVPRCALIQFNTSLVVFRG